MERKAEGIKTAEGCMSREQIPAFDCKECDKYKICKSLCAAAKQYANQDQKKQREKPIGLPHYNKYRDIFATKSREEIIIYLFFKQHVRVTEIAIYTGVSHQFVSKVIKKYHSIIIQNLSR